MTNLSQRTFEIETGDKVDEFDDKTYHYTKGLGSTSLKPTEIWRKKIPAGINSVDDNSDFSKMTDSDKK